MMPVFPGCHGSFPVAIIIVGVSPWMPLFTDTAQYSGQYLAGFTLCEVAGLSHRLCDKGRTHHFIVTRHNAGKINVADAVNDRLRALALIGKDSEAVTFYPPRRESPISWSFSSPITSTVIR